jgi:lipoprotein-anchoring transpeptidase ErfK/SrfK
LKSHIDARGKLKPKVLFVGRISVRILPIEASMHTSPRNFDIRRSLTSIIAATLLLNACARETPEAALDTAGTRSGSAAGTADTLTAATSSMRLEVDLAARELKVFEGGQQVATHPVAVGSEKWPTKTGEWTITQVIWNPDWTPPDESWAEEREPRESGDPKNPMGAAQLVYDPPRSIHGTNAPSSIGKPVSHGSIRLQNEVILALARRVVEAAGAGKDEAWYTAAQTNRRQKQVVDLPRPVPIRVY